VDNLTAFFEPLAQDDAIARDSGARQVLSTATSALTWLDRVGPPPPDTGPVTLTHGDLWTDHVRFDGARVSALLDLDTLGLRPPIGDLAALCSDFAEWDLARCAAVIDGYRRHGTVSRDMLEALPRLAALRTLGVLRDRLRAWLDPARHDLPEASLGGPVTYGSARLRTLEKLDLAAFASI
jgi:Ser/Thr protein kinase RdoA (MazF antagonist)